MNLKNRINATILNDRKFLEHIKYNKDGYYIHRKSKKKNIEVTIIMPVYNAEETIKKTIDSIIGQSIGFENIELLIIDDQSGDKSRFIILEYAKQHPNIIPVFLEHNSGTPAAPRNLGIDLAKGKYVMFIDSDDWLDKSGVQVLYNLLEKTGDNYAIGKTIKKNNKGTFVTGEYNNWKDRESIDPFSINHIFRHLAPTARMMKTALLKDNNIKFPNQKYAEDKQFFIDVLINSKSISTTKEIVYYINRYQDNKSLTKTTTIFEKMDSNMITINYVIGKHLPVYVEQMILARLFEFDFISRFLDKKQFLKANKKEQEKYLSKFTEALSIMENLDYDITACFDEPWHKVLVEFFREKRFEDIISLINWNINQNIKDYFIDNDLPYYVLPFADKNRARINMIAIHHKSIKEQDELVLQFKVYGDHVDKLNSLLIRERNNDLNDINFPIQHLEGNLFKTHIPFKQLEVLSPTSHAIFITHLDYRKVPIRMNVRNIVNYDKKKLDFYTTISDNFGLNIQ